MVVIITYADLVGMGPEEHISAISLEDAAHLINEGHLQIRNESWNYILKHNQFAVILVRAPYFIIVKDPRENARIGGHGHAIEMISLPIMINELSGINAGR